MEVLKEEKVESSSLSFEQELSTKPDLPSYIGAGDQNSASGNLSCGIFLPFLRFDVHISIRLAKLVTVAIAFEICSTIESLAL